MVFLSLNDWNGCFPLQIRAVFFPASLLDVNSMQIETTFLGADKYWSIKFLVNKASRNARDILDAFLNFTVIVVFVAASWLQKYKIKGCILETLRARCFLWVQDSYIPVVSKTTCL